MAQIKDPKNLKALLIGICPPDRKGQRSIARLAKMIGMSHYGVYKWINAGRMSREGAMLLVEFTKHRKNKITYEELMPFVFAPPGE